MVTSLQMEKHLDTKEYIGKTEDWVDSVYENIREAVGILQNTDLNPELREDSKKVAALPRELGIYDIRTINWRDIEGMPSFSKWGLAVFEPISVPKGLQPSSGTYYLEEGILGLFKEDGVAVIGDKIDHRKVKKEIRKITSGKSFEGEPLRRVFVMCTEDGFDLLCVSTFRFDQSKRLYELVKETEGSDYHDIFRLWYDDIVARAEDDEV